MNDKISLEIEGSLALIEFVEYPQQGEDDCLVDVYLESLRSVRVFDEGSQGAVVCDAVKS